MSSSGEVHSKWWMSEVRISGSTGKLVRATGCSPALTMKRSCLPAASHKKAIVFPSGDHCWPVGYLISAIRSMVILPRGACSASTPKVENKVAANKRLAEYIFECTWCFSEMVESRNLSTYYYGALASGANV